MPRTEAECIESLQRAADQLGESPTKEQYVNLEYTPAASTIMRILGGWNEAKQKAGLETYAQSDNGGFPVQPKPEWVDTAGCTSVTNLAIPGLRVSPRSYSRQYDLPEDKVWKDLSGNQRWYYKNRETEIQKKKTGGRCFGPGFTNTNVSTVSVGGVMRITLPVSIFTTWTLMQRNSVCPR